MTGSQPPEQRTPRHKADALTLEDSRSGSTLPVEEDADPGADATSASGSGSGSGSAPATESSQASSQFGGTEGGGTTGGFETLLGKLVVRSGLATRDEVDECGLVAQGSMETDRPQTLEDLLIGKDYVTRHQLNRLRQDFDAQKSGQHIPGFRLYKKLGSGAMATVFLAKQISLDRHVAIKILPKKFSGNARFIDRFYKEGRSAAQLNHPNIVGAYDVGRAGEHHYFVMEYVDGQTVHDLIAKSKRVKEEEAVRIVAEVARALEHAHSRGFVHRDIKPKNIMITKRGRVKLADLGLARAISDEESAKAEAGRAYGTPYYISPEQIRGEVSIGPAADLYGLGATLYHMVTGRVPFEGKNPSSVMHRHLKAPLEPPDHLNPEISAGCAQVIEMMMAKKLDDRYQSAKDLLEDLELIARGEPPHFAHRTLDHTAITDTLTGVASAAAVPDVTPIQTPPVTQSPLFLVMATIIVALVILVVILIVLMAG